MIILRGSRPAPPVEGRQRAAGPPSSGDPLSGRPPPLSASRSPPAAPPPPPLRSEGGGEGPAAGTRRAVRLRNFNWEAIPAERIRGRRNLWTAGGDEEEEGAWWRGRGRGRRRDFLSLDFCLLDELFGQRPEPPGGSLRLHPAGQVSLLEAKKVLNLGIFLKQFKRPVGEIVADLRAGEGAPYGAEKLLELSKMLPDAEEIQRLEAFRGDRSRLSEPEVFALLLIQVPSYARRLELLVLKEEFFPRLHSLRSAVRILTQAALELLDCEELHDLIRLVLRAGNYMNEGGYAGSALGFRVASLLKLADTKANKPGIDLLHFVAMEAERKDPALLCFPSKLQHVGPASRIMDQEVLVELQTLGVRLKGACGELPTLGWEDRMGPFLEVAEVELGATRASWEELCQATATLADFLCEERHGFSLPDSCSVFQAFAEHFLAAVQENRAREAAAVEHQQRKQRQEKQKRRSIATCSSCDPGLEDVQLDALFHRGPLRSGRRGRIPRGPHPAKSPAARECSPSQPLSRRHTLAVLPPPDPEATPTLLPLQTEAAPGVPVMPEAAPNVSLQVASIPSPVPLSTPGHWGKRAGLFGEGLIKALLGSSLAAAPAVTAPSPSPPSGGPEAPGRFCFPNLSSSSSSKKSLPEGPQCSTSPQGSPKNVPALVGFFCRLSLGEKPCHSSQS